MQITANAADLHAAMNLLKRAGNANSTLPILGCARLTFAPGTAHITLDATDLDISISTTIPITGPSVHGSCCIPIADLCAITRIADRKHTVTLTETTAFYTAAKATARRHYISLDSKDFPPLPAHTDKATCILQQPALDSIRKAIAFTSTDETRYVLNGVYCDPATGGNVIATDGRRLFITPARLPGKAFIMPAKTVAILSHPSLLGKPAVFRRNDENELFSLTFGATVIHSKTIQGNFPNYRQVIPPANEIAGSATIPASYAKPLTDWLKSLGNLSNEKRNSIKLTFPPNSITFSRRTSEEESAVTVPAAHSGTLPPFASFNPVFFRQAIEAGLLHLDLTDGESPLVATDGAARCVLMPMRVMDGDCPVNQEDKPAKAPKDKKQPATDIAADTEIAADGEGDSAKPAKKSKKSAA